MKQRLIISKKLFLSPAKPKTIVKHKWWKAVSRGHAAWSKRECESSTTAAGKHSPLTRSVRHGGHAACWRGWLAGSRKMDILSSQTCPLLGERSRSDRRSVTHLLCIYLQCGRITHDG